MGMESVQEDEKKGFNENKFSFFLLRRKKAIFTKSIDSFVWPLWDINEKIG